MVPNPMGSPITVGSKCEKTSALGMLGAEPRYRVLKAASLEVVGSLISPADLRRRAARLLARFELRPRDISAAIERCTAFYSDALMLATNVLQGRGRDLQAGESLGWTFLLRTPEMVEEGIRSILQKGL